MMPADPWNYRARSISHGMTLEQRPDVVTPDPIVVDTACSCFSRYTNLDGCDDDSLLPTPRSGRSSKSSSIPSTPGGNADLADSDDEGLSVSLFKRCFCCFLFSFTLFFLVS